MSMFTRLFIHHHPEETLSPSTLTHQFPSSSLWQTNFLSLWICPSSIYHINGIVKYVFFFSWLNAFTLSFEVHHVMVEVRTSPFLWLNSIPLYGLPHFVDLLINWRAMDLFQPLDRVNHSAVNICVYVFVSVSIFNSWRHT